MSYFMLTGIEKDMDIVIKTLQDMNESLDKLINTLMGTFHDLHKKINQSNNRDNEKRRK
jgi:prefoldin subunit 5